MLPTRNNRCDPNPEDDGDGLSAEEIWPVATKGPGKGKVIPTLDTRGNVVVDPAGNFVKPYLLDFNVYKALRLQEEARQGKDGGHDEAMAAQAEVQLIKE